MDGRQVPRAVSGDGDGTRRGEPEARPGGSARAARRNPGIVLVVGLALALYLALFVVWASGRTDEWYRYVAGLQGLLPLVAALFALRRLSGRRRGGAADRRYAAGLAVFALALLFWAAGELGLLYYGAVAPELPLFPTWLDILSVASAVCLAAVLFVTAEGYVDASGKRFDFLRAVSDDARMLAVFFGGNLALLVAFHGADLRSLLETDDNARAVGYSLDVFYTTMDVFLFWMAARLVHGEPGRAMVRGRASLVLLAAGLGLLYAADLVFTLNYAVGERRGEFLFSRYFGIVPDVVYVAAVTYMAIAALLYPIEPPVFADGGG